MPKYQHTNARATTETMKQISLTMLKKHNCIQGLFIGTLDFSKTENIGIKVDTKNQNPHIGFHYKIQKEKDITEMEYAFELQKIPCNFGGFKWFFICGLYTNNKYCGKRVRILYESGNDFGCRKCANLSYKSCNKSKITRHGSFKVLTQLIKAKDYLPKVRKKFYRKKPTKKYIRYLKIINKYKSSDIKEIQKDLKNLEF